MTALSNASFLLAVITLTVAMAPATAAPATAAPATMVPPAVCVTGSCVQPGTVSSHPQQRRIQVILPNRQTVIVPVRPGQDDRAAAFEYFLKRSAMTIADANQLQALFRVTGIWLQGPNGIDIVDLQFWD